MPQQTKPPSNLRKFRLVLWIIVVLALCVFAAFMLIHQPSHRQPGSSAAPAQASFGGPFTLTGGDGKPFSSASLLGKPYALYFGFTRCGDVCPTTLSRMVKLRNEAGGDDSFRIVFITIDPKNDGPKEVGQYATLFNSPIIGLTGTPQRIDRVKKQYGIYAQPVPHAAMGQEVAHTATVLLFDRGGKFVGTITPEENDEDALTTLRQLVG